MSTKHREGAPVPIGYPDDPLYPEIEVQLTGEDGNGFFIAARTRSAIKRGLREMGWDREQAEFESKRYFDEALSGSYGHLLSTTARWVTVL